MVQDIYIVHAIWGGNIADLKGGATRKKTIHVAGELVIIPKEFIKLQKDVFMMADIFFVNGIPFFILPSRNNNFAAVIHLTENPLQIFKSFKEVYIYYLKHGFWITILHADGKFAPLQELIYKMPGGGKFNLENSTERVPEI